tara:strand:+ start:123 stop:299 length:177 start_codon:yes stop_codon:yes gene_type:complete
MRDLKSYTQYAKAKAKKARELAFSRLLRKEVHIGNGGTQGYVLKAGVNKGKLAKGFTK